MNNSNKRKVTPNNVGQNRMRSDSILLKSDTSCPNTQILKSPKKTKISEDVRIAKMEKENETPSK